MKEIIHQDFNKRKFVCRQELVKIVENLSGFDRVQGEYLIAYMSDADLDVKTEHFVQHLNHYIELYKKEYVQKIPLEYYFNYVLHPRVNNEKFVNPRPTFYHEVIDLCDDKNISQSIIDINHWVAGEVHYGRSDARTRNSLLTWKTGKGRCGEKSTFLVDVYRSVGIPARQIYAPWWNHSDDRHAWVEVYVDDEWRYLGAGEGEETFNKAWFSLAASRAGIVHANHFSNILDTEEVLDNTKGMFKTINRTEMYQKVKKLKIQTTLNNVDSIDLCVVNYGEMAVMITLKVIDKHAFVHYGHGDCYARIIIEDKVYLKAINENDTEVLIGEDDLMIHQRLIQKAGTLENIPAYNESKELLDERDRKRTYYGKQYVEKQEFINNHPINNVEKIKLIEALGSDVSSRILAELSEKDQEDFESDILIQHYLNVKKYQDLYDADIFYRYLSHPRFYCEELTDYVLVYKNMFITDEDLEETIAYIHNLVEEKIVDCSDYAIPDTFIPLSVMLSYGHGNMIEKELLKLAIARSNGIACRFNENTKMAEYFSGNDFIPFCQESYKRLVLDVSDRSAVVSVKNIYSDRCFIVEGDTEHCEVNIPRGVYEVLMHKRLPNGTIIGDYHIVHVDDEDMELSLKLEDVNLVDMIDHIEIQDLLDELAISFDDKGIIIIGESTKEPTHHILNELMDNASQMNLRTQKIYFFEKDDVSHDSLLKLAEASLSNFQVLPSFDSGLENRLTRRVFGEPGVYPLLIVYKDGYAQLSNSGYQVGLIDNSWFMELCDL